LFDFYSPTPLLHNTALYGQDDGDDDDDDDLGLYANAHEVSEVSHMLSIFAVCGTPTQKTWPGKHFHFFFFFFFVCVCVFFCFCLLYANALEVFEVSRMLSIFAVCGTPTQRTWPSKEGFCVDFILLDSLFVFLFSFCLWLLRFYTQSCSQHITFILRIPFDRLSIAIAFQSSFDRYRLSIAF
jgi:hypothetical protein